MIDFESINDYETLYNKIGCQFTNNTLLKEALTHPSLSKSKKNYERMEFLGDSILNMIISEELFNLFPDEPEGLLAKRRSNLVCGETLYKISSKLELGKHIIMTSGERKSGGETNKNNLENVLESLIACIYLDQDIEQARKFILKNWNEYMLNSNIIRENSKVILQELSQKNGLPIPEYKIIMRKGPEHAPIFTVEVKIKDKKAIGEGHNRKKAEQIAAKNLLKTIQK